MYRIPVPRSSSTLEPFANVILRNNRRLLLEVCVPTGVVAVIVRIDDEAYGPVSDAFQRGLNSVGQRGVLVVDDHDAVIANRCTDIPGAISLQHVHISANLRDPYLHLAEIFVLGGE